MKIKPLFCNVTEEQIKVFDSIAPIIERVFPNSFCFTDCWTNSISFQLKYDIKQKDKTIECYPNQNLINSLYDYLLYLKIRKSSKINFKLLCDEIGNAWGIEAVC